MHCEDARDALLDSLDGRREDGPATLHDHLAGCADCRALQGDLTDMAARARVWHELAPPAWNPLGTPGHDAPAAGWLAALRIWFAPTASALALLLALGAYWQAPAGRMEAPLPAAYPADRAPASGLRTVSADASGAGGDLLAEARAERQEALEALTALLKAEMDRRSLETEQSLKYIISHQIQSQRQLEAIRSRLNDAPPTGERL